MEKRKIILTIELESSEKVKVLKLAVIQALDNDETEVIQFQANVIEPKTTEK